MLPACRTPAADAHRYLGDPGFSSIPVTELLSEPYAQKRAAAISLKHTIEAPRWGDPLSSVQTGGDTVYFCVVDGQGNACSFINSNFMGFGTGIVPQGCGYSLQKRGYGFVLDAEHPNGLAPAKRPYHTIIPALSTRTDRGGLHAVFGVMGGLDLPRFGLGQVILHDQDGVYWGGSDPRGDGRALGPI
jgi:gamma-glutamyltranspeptidase/glutathione hydrolase